MGLTKVEAEVANPVAPARHATVGFLVDSGAVYSVIPQAELEALGIESPGERTFFLAKGQPVRRRVGEARITFAGQTATCVVSFGEGGDSTLLADIRKLFADGHSTFRGRPCLNSQVTGVFCETLLGASPRWPPCRSWPSGGRCGRGTTRSGA